MRLSTNPKKLVIAVGARSSPLSQAQVKEVLAEIRTFHPYISFEIILIDTTGDKDQQTSLRTLNKTNFFTKEIDQAIVENQCRIGIHSAKDLPEHILDGLKMICLTRGVSSADSLVMARGMSLKRLPPNAKIATSSIRREEMVKQLRDDLTFCDVRGTIGQRLALLESGSVDGVVVAEAALIRLDLLHLNRIQLPGNTVEGQGQLAIIANKSDQEMIDLFACMDVRSLKAAKN